jgi:hypothetical protein
MYGYSDRKLVRSKTPHSSKRVTSNDTELRLSNRKGNQDTEPLLLDHKGKVIDIPDMPLMYHVKGIVRGLQKRFKAMPLLIRIVLTSLAMYMLSSMVNILVQIMLLSMNCVYTIVGIIASIIVIYEFFMKEQQKKSRWK